MVSVGVAEESIAQRRYSIQPCYMPALLWDSFIILQVNSLNSTVAPAGCVVQKRGGKNRERMLTVVSLDTTNSTSRST